MQTLTAVVIGATGLTGNQLVHLLLNDSAFSKISILVRRPVQLSHPKLLVEQVDFSDEATVRSKLGKPDCVFCCIGTTQRQVKGDLVKYRQIDIELPLSIGKMAKEAGASKFLMVSAAGANTASRNFYLKIKGEAENAITKLGFSSFHTFRPSIILGEREKFRFKEALAKPLMKVLNLILVGRLKKYRSIQAVTIARSMAFAATSNTTGVIIHDYAAMIKESELYTATD